MYYITKPIARGHARVPRGTSDRKSVAEQIVQTEVAVRGGAHLEGLRGAVITVISEGNGERFSIDIAEDGAVSLEEIP